MCPQAHKQSNLGIHTIAGQWHFKNYFFKGNKLYGMPLQKVTLELTGYFI